MRNKVNVVLALCVLGIGTLSPRVQGTTADTLDQRRNHIAGRPLFYSKNMDPGLPMPPIFDEVIQQIRNGVKISSETVQQCKEASWTYFYDLLIENDVQKPWDMLEADRVNYFMVMIKRSFISPEECMGTFGNMHLLNFLPDAIKRRQLVDDDPFLILCSIFPAVAQKDFDKAVEIYKELLGKDPLLARHALKCHEFPYPYNVDNERNAKFLKLAKAL